MAKVDPKTENHGEVTSHAKGNAFNTLMNIFKNNTNLVYGVVIAILLIICGYFAFEKFYLTPRTDTASALMQDPIEFMQKGDSLSLSIALEGNEEIDGFLTIASDYKMTKAGKTANYFAGLCYLKLEDKEEALNYLLKYNNKDIVYWYACQALIGDIYMDLGDKAKAISYYENAVGNNDPYFTPISLVKLAKAYEAEGKNEKAVAMYERIKADFYAEYETMGVAKHLEAAKLK